MIFSVCSISIILVYSNRCYITLTTALHLHKGGSPKGPAGTGKTETVKDLGKSLGSYVIVVNCSEGLDYKSMGRMFAGLAQVGAVMTCLKYVTMTMTMFVIVKLFVGRTIYQCVYTECSLFG